MDGVNLIDGKHNEIQTANKNMFSCCNCTKTFCVVDTANGGMEDFLKDKF
jgi:hypothetical protein